MLTTNQNAGFVTVPSENKIKYDTFVFLAKECYMILLFFFYSVNICNMTLSLFVERTILFFLQT